MLRHLPTGVFSRTPTLITSVPKELTRKQPLISEPEKPSPKVFLQKRLKSIQTTDPKPDLFDGHPDWETMNT